MFTLIKRTDKQRLYTYELHYKGKCYRKNVFFVKKEGIYGIEFPMEDTTERQLPFKEILTLKGTDFPDKLSLDRHYANWEGNVQLPLDTIVRKGNTVYFQYVLFVEDIEQEHVPEELIVAYLKRTVKKFKKIKVQVLDDDTLFVFDYAIPVTTEFAVGYAASRRQMDLFFNPAINAINKVNDGIDDLLKSLKKS